MAGCDLLRDLLRECVALASHACFVIRSVQYKRENDGIQTLKAELKDPMDPRTYLTEADRQAQQVIVEGLQKKFGNTLTIVAEEEATSIPTLVTSELQDITRSCSIAFDEGYTMPPEFANLDLSEVCVFVDPVDGTREFVECRLHAVQCLIGIAYRGRAIAGVVGLPFFSSEAAMSSHSFGTQVQMIYGVVGSQGIVGLPYVQQGKRKHNDSDPVMALALSAEEGKGCPALMAARDVILGPVGNNSVSHTIIHAGGCGNKILKLLLGQADATLFNLSSSRWDTCATEALLVAAGGRLTTLLGWPIEHSCARQEVDVKVKSSYGNWLGVLATTKDFGSKFGKSHAELCSILRGRHEVLQLLKDLTPGADTPQAVDITRRIDGEPFTSDDLSLAVFNECGKVKSYSAPEVEAVRYKQSHACRVRLSLTNADSRSGSLEDVKSVFCKRIVLRELPYALQKMRTAPFKLARDVQANLNEARFVTSDLVQEFNNRFSPACKIVVAHKLEQQAYAADSHPVDSRFTLLLHDFCREDGWEQYPHLRGRVELQSTLRCLAQFHAFFWLGRRHGGKTCGQSLQNLAADMWQVATYWDLGKLPSGHLTGLVSNWEGIVDELHVDLSQGPGGPGGIPQTSMFHSDRLQATKMLGKRLHEVSQEIHDRVHCSAQVKPQAIIHGDPKAPNCFFRAQSAVDDLPQVGLIDFQWTGKGLCATDVAYCILASMSPEDCAAPDAAPEVEWLRLYHASLKCAMVDLGVAPDESAAAELLPFAQFEQEYQWAFLDLCRAAIASPGGMWQAGKLLSTLRQREAMHERGYLVFNAYNKSVAVAKWMMERMRVYLEQYD